MPAPQPNVPPLVAALMHPTCYPHAVRKVELLETHISWVFLTGDYAYKVKKPVDLGFLDFSTLEARRRCCEDELRLNRRLAPDLYVDVVEIRGAPDSPRVAAARGHGPVLEYAVRMREFTQEALASRVLARGALRPGLVTALASRIAAFHARSPQAPEESAYGTPEAVLRSAQENFTQVSALLDDADDRAALESVRDWTEREFIRVCCELEARRSGGRIRECHGDLHLANIVLLEGALVPFDCIEFNADLRWIDVMSEVAFVMMDLLDRGADRLAWLFLNDYLEASGDYSGLGVLRLYLVYRAMVRAKVHLLRAAQCHGEAVEQRRLTAEYRGYVELALRCASLGRPAVLLMHGFSGCGKSMVARELAQALGAISVRSDVERKRLHGLEALQRSGSDLAGGIYARAAGEATYARLTRIACDIARAGYTAIVDAAFLERAKRARLHAAAEALDVRAAIVDVHAPAATLRARVAARAARGSDPSEATLEVLERQMAAAEPISADERLPLVRVDGRRPIARSAVEEVLRHLPSALPARGPEKNCPSRAGAVPA